MRLDPDRFIVTDVGGETFVLDQGNGASYRIGGCGPRLLELLASGITVDQATNVIATESGAPAERVRADIQEFIAGLTARGLLPEDQE